MLDEKDLQAIQEMPDHSGPLTDQPDIDEKASASDQLRIKKWEDEVTFLKAVIRYMLTDLDNLKKAQ